MKRDAFERLYAEHAQPLFGLLVYRTGNPALAEDLLADTFERALRARRSFDPRKGREKTWLYTIAINLLRDHARRAAVEQRALSELKATPGDATQASGVDAVDERDAVRRALGCLSEEEREAIAVRYGADLTIKEVARVLGERESTVEGRVYRALEKLRAELA